jgi:aspartate racemase
MGPMSTVDVFQKIICCTEAEKYQDHHHIIINSDPKIPSSVDAFMNGKESPLPALIQSAKVLEKAGGYFIIITLSYFSL